MLDFLMAAGNSGGGGGSLPQDPNFDSVSFLMNADGNSGGGSYTPFVNEATNYTMTSPDGTATTIYQGNFTPTGNSGWAHRFANGEGTISSVNLPASTTAWVFNGDFTVDFWFKWTGGPSESATKCLIGTGWTSGTPWEIFFNSTGLALTSGVLRIQGNTAIQLNQWYHVECSRTGSTVYLFLNGVQQGTWSFAGTIGDSATARVLRLGNANGTARFFGGLMADVRVNNTTGFHTSGFTPPTTPTTVASGTTLLTCHKPFVTNDGTGGTATIVGQVFAQPDSPYSRADVQHTSTNNGGSITHVQACVTGTEAAIARGTGDFTVEGWVYFNNPAAATRGSVFSSYGASTQFGFGLIWDTNRIPTFYIGQNTAGNFSFLSGGTAIPFGQWCWLVGTRQGGTTSIYVNGVRIAQGTDTRNLTGTTYAVGRYYADNNTTTHVSNAITANVRVLNYSAYSGATIAVPTTAPANVSGTIFLYRGGNVGVTDVTQTTNLRCYAGAALTDTVTKWGPTSALFNGTDQYLESDPSSKFFLSASSDWTVEAWIRPSNLSQEMSIFGFGDGGTSFATNLNGWMNITAANQMEWGYSDGTINQAVTSSGLNIQAGVWNHVAVVFDGATKTVSLYANGLRGFSGTINTYAPGQRRPRITIARRPTLYTTAPRFYAGAVDDARISTFKRYTGATYTVPATNFPIR